MEICRLCGNETEDLVIALADMCGAITLKEYVEFFCHLQLDADESLPQKICSDCKNLIARFVEYCFQVEELQNKLIENRTKAEGVNVTTETADTLEVKTEILDIPLEEPESLLLDIKEECGEAADLIEALDIVKHEQETGSSVEKDCQSRKLLPKKCMTLKSGLQLVNELFSPVTAEMIMQFDHISASEYKVLAHGRVKSAELKITWKRVKFQCNCSCNKTYKGLHSLKKHIPNIKKSTICCVECGKSCSGYFALSTLMNHMTRHFPRLRFCCFVCNKFFINVPALTQHCISEHPDFRFKIFPCLQCGLFCQSADHIRRHLSVHGRLKS